MMHTRQYYVWLKGTADQNGMTFTLYVTKSINELIGIYTIYVYCQNIYKLFLRA
jgi:hypothetical protein